MRAVVCRGCIAGIGNRTNKQRHEWEQQALENVQSFYVRRYLFRCLHIRVNIYIYIYIYTVIHMYVYIYIYAYMHV